MTPELLARVIGLPPHAAIEWSAGAAREYFYAEALRDDATRNSGGKPARHSVELTGVRTVTRVFHPPKQFAATLSSVRQEIGDARWESGRLVSFSIDGTPVDQRVQPLVGERGLRGWVVSRIQAVLVVSSESVTPIGTRSRARRIEVLGGCVVDGQPEVQLHGTPGLWRVSKGVVGALSPPRGVMLRPTLVRSAWVDTLGGFVPSEHLLAGEVNAEELSDGAPAVVIDAVLRQLGAGDADDVERAAAVVVGLLRELGDAASDGFDASMPRSQLDETVTEALRLLSLDDPPPEGDPTVA